MSALKTHPGNYFEDFSVGQVIEHATPRTITAGDTALYLALTGSRFVPGCAEPFAHSLGFPETPVDDWLVFHMVFGKTVPDISLNAVANLGYAAGRFLAPVYRGDTLSAVSEVIGLKENSNGETGTVHVRSIGQNQLGETVLDYVRWVMVRKRNKASPAPILNVPTLPDAVPVEALAVPDGLVLEAYDDARAGSPWRWGDYAVGEKIDHVDGVTVEEAEHQLATRLYQNTAKVHFNQYEQGQGRFGRRLIYGGHVISLARALSFNGLGNAFKIAGLNGGRHVAPCFAGDTVYAWSEVLAAEAMPGRVDLGALRLRTYAVKNRSAADFPGRIDDGYDPAVILELDYWVLMPR
ncbi:MAG TPA: MaoC family dehydratase [Aliidongia sp.]|uniref:MaoC family dehydratase n=1 Tax=Aliidongia sp. TaxID=1914230 RepID=UPI002DDD39AF|nr:MaoC family dehydratase [Aliidongia sp.]HEV2674025.1 MaoC family dehydratase [Aliidongia sp.]